MATYGWYYEEGSVRDVCSSGCVWSLLDHAVREAVEDERLPRIRFGPAAPLRVSDLLNEDDVQSMIEDERLTPEEIREVVYERAGEIVEDGTAHLSGSYREAFERVEHGTPAEILAWAVDHIELDPDTYYNGRYPLPIEYVEGEWRFGCKDPEPPEHAAVIDHAVREAVEDERLPRIRFGPAAPLRVSDLLNEDDVQSMIEDERLTPEEIREVVYERAGEIVEDGTAHLSGSYREAFERVEHGTPAEILAWAVDHIELGEWRFGCKDPEPPEHAAVITYASEPSPETGHVEWCWWALGRMGDAPTLPDAMAACMGHIRAAIDGGGET